MEIVSLKSGLVPTISIGGGSVEARASPSHMSAVGRSAADKSPLRSLFSRVSFRISFDSLWPRGNTRYKGLALDDAVLAENAEGKEAVRDDGQLDGAERRSGNWVLKMLHVNSAWEGKQINEEEVAVGDQNQTNDDNEEEEDMCECDSGCMVDGDEEEVQFDRGSFSRMLRRVSLAEARLYAQMSHLGSLAYDIRNIKPGKLLRQYGMRFVTSSIEKKELAATAEKDPQKVETNEKEKEEEKKDPKHGEYNVRENASYNIAASAASYLHSRTRSIFPFKSSNAAEGSLEGSNESLDSVNMINTEVASLMATTDSMTAVVAAKEEVKQAVADDLNSVHSTPCEWFVCDDDQSGTRLFAIQGSETLASWQANLLFEPVKFEGLDVLVHRGIYEAAKGIYQQMLPEVHAHLKSRGSRATFRFTGHSLGGSLALLVNLMLLIRHEVPVSSLLPVITFGSPSIMCGGDSLLEKLGLPKSHVQAITMHRDIVPRAFSCNYPNHVAKLLKAVNGNFRSHPCLNKQKLLYAPMGYLLILQPDEKFSPGHHLLPSGSGLYVLSESNDAEKQLRAAQSFFLNTPHPLEILSDRSAYGSRGSIQRDHDMNSYVRSVRTVIRQELKQIRKAKKEQQQQRKVWWPLVLSRGIDAGILAGRSMISVNVGQRQSPFSGMVRTGRESLKRFSRLVTSQYMHLFLLLWFPARLLLLKL